MLNPLDNHRQLEIESGVSVKLFQYDPVGEYEMKGVTTVVQNSSRGEEGPERQANLLLVSQLRANGAI